MRLEKRTYQLYTYIYNLYEICVFKIFINKAFKILHVCVYIELIKDTVSKISSYLV